MCQEQLFQALQGSWNLVLDLNIRVLLRQGQDEDVRMDIFLGFNMCLHGGRCLLQALQVQGTLGGGHRRKRSRRFLTEPLKTALLTERFVRFVSKMSFPPKL